MTKVDSVLSHHDESLCDRSDSMDLISKKRIVDAISSCDEDFDHSKIFKIRDGSVDRASSASYHVTFSEVFSYNDGDVVWGNNGDSLFIRPKETLVLRTKEYFFIPKNIFGLCFNRVWGAVRCLQIDTTFVDPGYEGCLTIVVTNHGNESVQIKKTMLLSKVIFFSLDTEFAHTGVSSNRNDISEYLNHLNQRICSEKKAKLTQSRKKEQVHVLVYFFLAIVFLLLISFLFWLIIAERDPLETIKAIMPLFIAIVFAPLTNFISSRMIKLLVGSEQEAS